MRLLGVLLSCVVLLTLCSPVSASTWNVPADAPTIQAGIDSASAGDTVLVACGTYAESVELKPGITLSSETGLPDCVTIESGSRTVVHCGSTVDSTTLIQGVTILGASDDGAYCVDGAAPRFIECVFSGNGRTGAVYDHSSPSFVGCVFSGNGSGAQGQGGRRPSTGALFPGTAAMAVCKTSLEMPSSPSATSSETRVTRVGDCTQPGALLRSSDVDSSPIRLRTGMAPEAAGPAL
jgi:hypothetical protein